MRSPSLPSHYYYYYYLGHSLILMVFLYYYFGYYYLALALFYRLPLNLFQCDWCPCFSVTGAHVSVVLFCFVFFPALGRGLVAGLWILLATGGGSILQGFGCSPSVELSVGT